MAVGAIITPEWVGWEADNIIVVWGWGWAALEVGSPVITAAVVEVTVGILEGVLVVIMEGMEEGLEDLGVDMEGMGEDG